MSREVHVRICESVRVKFPRATRPLRVVVDLGFDTTTRQYIRLKGIDCPELEKDSATKKADPSLNRTTIRGGEGQAAKRFVENALQGLEFVTVKTSRSDKYDRYLADVFLPARSLKASAVPTALDKNKIRVGAGGTGATGHEYIGKRLQSAVSSPQSNLIYLNNLLLENGHAVRVRG